MYNGLRGAMKFPTYDLTKYASSEYRFCVNETTVVDNDKDYIYQLPYKAEIVNDGEKINIYFKTIFVKAISNYP